MRAVPPAPELEEIRRVLILSADVGSGHLVSARALASELEHRGVAVAVEEDLRSSLGWLPRLVIRDGSRVLFAHAPRLYDLYYRLLLRCPPARAMAAASLRRSGARRLLRLVRRHEPDAVVSTYPGVTVVLGELRRRRRLTVPVLAMITDLAGLFFWAHRGVDMHLLAWPQSAAEVERISRSQQRDPRARADRRAPSSPRWIPPRPGRGWACPPRAGSCSCRAVAGESGASSRPWTRRSPRAPSSWSWSRATTRLRAWRSSDASPRTPACGCSATPRR